MLQVSKTIKILSNEIVLSLPFLLAPLIRLSFRPTIVTLMLWFVALRLLY
jgi:hypothetical protein